MDKSSGEPSEAIISNTSRMKSRRPDMQLYVPRARRKSNEIVSENVGKVSSSCTVMASNEGVRSKLKKKKKLLPVEELDFRDVSGDKKEDGCENVRNVAKSEDKVTSVIASDVKPSKSVVIETKQSENVKMDENQIENTKNDGKFSENTVDKVKKNDKLYEKNVQIGLKQGLHVKNDEEIDENAEENRKLSKSIRKNDTLYEKNVLDGLKRAKSDRKSPELPKKFEEKVKNVKTEKSDVKFSEKSSEETLSDPTSNKTEDLHQNINKNVTELVDDKENKLKLEPIASNQVDNKEQSETVKSETDEEEENSWEALYNEDGDCLRPHLIKELTDTLGEVSIQKPKIDYTKFQFTDPVINESEFGHVIEIYDFPVEFKTQDLMVAFAQYKDRGFDIKWIDETHALGLFASPIAAADALTIRHPMMKTRALSEASRESKLKARRCGEFLLPYKPRPQTSASLARRLVTGALGLRVKIPREQQEKERQKLNEAKEKKKLAAKQKNDAWEGVIQ